ncbi:radical SAM protein [Candidatus Woesearchaeota archaeon]|nr:radical SAM protein [Candidatus Woesearchaeota archaeon]
MKQKKVSLVSAGVSRNECPRYSRFQSLNAPGMFYLKASLENAGYEVDLINQPTDGLTDEEVRNEIEVSNPDFVLFNQFYSTRERVKAIVESLDIDCVVGVGGHDPTFNAFETDDFEEEYSHVDFVWAGEAETGLPGFLETIVAGSGPLLVDQRDNRVQDLDSLPVLKHDDYSGDTGFLTTSRGCMRRGCDFCTTPSFYKDGWRERSVEHVGEELENLAENGKKYVMITDDNFLGFSEEDLERGHSILQRCAELDLKVMFLTMTDRLMKADSKGYLEQWADAAFRIFIGVENGDECAVRKLGKCKRSKDHRGSSQQAIQRLYEVGIPPLVGYINFNPESTFEELASSAEFLYKSGMEAAKFINLTQELRIFEGTRTLEKFKEENKDFEIIEREYVYRFDNPAVDDFFRYMKDEVRCEVTDDTDQAIFDIEELLYVNKLQDTDLGKEYWELREMTNEHNYCFFMEALETFRQGAEKPSAGRFLEDSVMQKKAYDDLQTRITQRIQT